MHIPFVRDYGNGPFMKKKKNRDLGMMHKWQLHVGLVSPHVSKYTCLSIYLSLPVFVSNLPRCACVNKGSDTCEQDLNKGENTP